MEGAERMRQVTRFFGLGVQNAEPDDRILPVTRWVGRILVPILAGAFIILFGLPERTTELFAWTIRPNMTPILMGAGYGTGAYFFYRVATTDNWHEVALVFPGIVVFTWFMAIATALHWENFNHSHITFAIWVFLYVAAPLLVPAIWLLNRRTDPRQPVTTDIQLPKVVQLVGGVSGLLITVIAVALLLVPELLMSHWPWDTSPLTARIMLGWFALFGVVNLGVAFDARWSGARIPVQTQMLGFGLLLLGVIRAWGDFDTTNPATWGFVGGFTLYLLALIALYSVMESHRPAGPA